MANDPKQLLHLVFGGELASLEGVEFKDLKSGKVLWSNPAVQFREEYEPATAGAVADVTAFFGQDVNAYDRIATEFARSVVSALLEAF